MSNIGLTEAECREIAAESARTEVGPQDFTYNTKLAAQREALRLCHRRIKHWEQEAAKQLALILETRRTMRVHNIKEQV